MDLKNFITESLYQIVGGIHAAKEKIAEVESDIELIKTPKLPPEEEGEHHEIYFDVALTVIDEKSEPSQSKLLVMGLSHLSLGSFEQMLSLVSRVKFSVPISFVHATKEQYPYFDLNAH